MKVNLELVKQITDSVKATSAREYKAIVEDRLGALLFSGEITKEDMQEIEQYLDDNMYGALAAKVRVNEQLDSSNFSILPPKAQNLILKTGLSHSVIEEVIAPYMDDYTINTVKLNNKEKKDAKAGRLTPSEEENIKNAINAKINENSSGKTLNKKEVRTLLTSLGFDYDTVKDVKAHDFFLHLATLGIYTVAKSKTKDEHGFPTTENMNYIKNGSVTNETEAKMQDLSAIQVQKENNYETEYIPQIDMPEEI